MDMERKAELNSQAADIACTVDQLLEGMNHSEGIIFIGYLISYLEIPLHKVAEDIE